ncbi:MAG: hypothetical protein RLZZ490_1782, partial [Cyanobacteriota bacterium]
KRVRDIVKMVAPILDFNPRRIKAFINLFRLKIYIARATGLLDKSNPLTFEQLGKFIAIGLKWPLLINDLYEDERLLARLHYSVSSTTEYYAPLLGENKPYDDAFIPGQNELSEKWKSYPRLLELIGYGWNFDKYYDEIDYKTTLIHSPKDRNFNLATLDVKALLKVSPQVIYQAKLGDRRVWLPKDFIELVDIPAGTFWMGSADDDPDAEDDEKPRHQITLSAFQIGKYPITHAQYEVVMGNNPSGFVGNPNHPVEQVTWQNAQEFCQRLSQITGQRYRLPTEAEWEYACRAGTETHYYFGDDESELENYAWFHGNSDGQTHPVGEKRPNAWGLYDMHGNVWEWCADSWHGSYATKPSRFKKQGNEAWVDKSTKNYVLRGGSWRLPPGNCRSAYRNDYLPDFQNSLLGLRVVCVGSREP